jgi:serine/threonine protein kinase
VGKEVGGEGFDQTVVQDDAERARSKDRSEALPRPEVPGYEMERQLGAGSYGEVWLAIHKNTGRKVAIKFFSRFKGLDWPLLKREVGKLVEVVSERRVVHLFHVGWDADPPPPILSPAFAAASGSRRGRRLRESSERRDSSRSTSSVPW